MDHLNVLWLVGVGAVLLIVAGRTYPYWIGRVFDEDDARPTPADTLADGRDYVKTPSAVVFAHHFASIAGAGPIVGPIIAAFFVALLDIYALEYQPQLERPPRERDAAGGLQAPRKPMREPVTAAARPDAAAEAPAEDAADR